VSFRKMNLEQITAYLEQAASLSSEEETSLELDRRCGARHLLYRYRKRRLQLQQEQIRLDNMLSEERIFWNRGLKVVAGVDEAGRGPLAGPVVAAAVILPPETVITGLNDSKQLTAAVREALYDVIMQKALAVATGIGSVAEIEQLNIYGALMLAMRKALAALPVTPDVVLVDGYPIRDITIEQKAIIRGDSLSLSIAAASVVAKVTRDRLMVEIHRRYPLYGFEQHKGYATGEHRSALARYGPCPEHRLSFNLSGRHAAEEGP
jgi:ribonuclease HII